MRSRLPERLSGTVPPVVVEVAVGLAMAALLTLLRLALLQVTGERAPYAFVFVAVIGAAVLAGWRSGLLALLAGQWLAWTLIVSPGALGAPDAQLVGGLAVSTIAELVALAIVTLYQREVARASSRLESERDLLEKALREIDHRTSNNYQTVLALVLAQAKSATEPGARDALQQVADRIRAIASASRKLAVASENLEQVRIAEHLQGLCDEIERGLIRPGIRLECAYDDLVLDAVDAVCVSILVNELVTNALKHAFPDDRGGTINVSLVRRGDALELTVADDGAGMKASGKTGAGLGTRLVETFARQLKARHVIDSDSAGTRHRIHIPR